RNGPFSLMRAATANSPQSAPSRSTWRATMPQVQPISPPAPFDQPAASLDQMIAELAHCRDTLPTQAVVQARRQWGTFLPRLLEEMRAAIALARDEEDPGEIAFWGVALLAERQPGEADQALPVQAEILSLADDQIDLLIGDLLTEIAPQALASAAGRQIHLLDQMFGDPAVDVYARWTIGNALLHLVAEGILPREQAVEMLGRHLRRVLDQHSAGTFADDPFYPSVIMRVLAQLLPHEEVDEMLAACAAGIVAEFAANPADIRRRVEAGEAGLEDALNDVLAREVDDCLRSEE